MGEPLGCKYTGELNDWNQGAGWSTGLRFNPNPDEVPVMSVTERELFAYVGCGPVVSTSHLTPPRKS